MKRSDSDAYLANIHTSSSFKKRIQHDYTPPEQQEPLHDATLVDDRIQAMKMHSISSKKRHKKKFGLNKPATPEPLSPIATTPTAAQAEELLVYRKGKKVLQQIDDDSLDNVLKFSSAFESGNLLSATKIGEYEYNLILSPDLGTDLWVQWFYFEVQGMKKGCTYKFNINNFYKVDSLFNYGLKPLLYVEGEGWKHCGEDIAYLANDKYNEATESNFYTLTWTFTPDRDLDTVYWAQSYPYTYSDLQDYLADLEAKSLPFLERDILCYSLAHNRLDLLTITAPTDNELELKSRPGVILSARVHPGETPASWMMKGALDFLTSNDPDAVYLREHYVFKVIPMLNPDGVILGNYRCSLAGEDLNRVWLEPDALTYPEIFGFKKFIHDFSEERNVILFLDLHSHSKKKDIFAFGNTSKNRTLRLYTRVFPYLLSKHSNHLVNYNYCTFTIGKLKRSTARVVAFKDLKLQNSFTLEASMCGPSHEDVHYRTTEYENMGAFVPKALIKYEDKPYVQKLVLQLSQMHHQREKKLKKKEVKKNASVLQQAKKAGRKANQEKKKLTPSQKLLHKEGSKFVLVMSVLPVVAIFATGLLYGF